MFKCSNIQMFEHPNFQMLNVQIFKCSNVQMFKCSNAQMFKCSNVQNFKCSTFQMFKCSNFQMFKYSNGQIFKCFNVKYQILIRLNFCLYVPPEFLRSFLSKWALMEIDLFENHKQGLWILKVKIIGCAHHRSKQSNKKGFHEEHSFCGWSSENPVQVGGKCNRWNMDQSAGKVYMSKMLWWKFDTFAVTCSTLPLVQLMGDPGIQRTADLPV